MIAHSFAKFPLAILLLLIGQTGVSAPESNQPDDSDYILRSGDRITVTVFNEPDLTAEQEIDPDGVVVLPLLGRTNLAGKSPREAETFIEQRYVEEQFLIDPQVTIAIQQYAKQIFYVFGEVGNPGAKSIPAGRQWIDILEAITMAGDLSEFAKRGDILLRRPIPGTDRERRIPVDLDELIRGGKKDKASQQIRIYPEDILYVPERMF